MTYAPAPRPSRKEGRKAPRRPIDVRVWLKYGTDLVLVPCRLLDISAGGARLDLPCNEDVPDQFVMLLSECGTKQRKCLVAWRSPSGLGVKFVN